MRAGGRDRRHSLRAKEVAEAHSDRDRSECAQRGAQVSSGELESAAALTSQIGSRARKGKRTRRDDAEEVARLFQLEAEARVAKKLAMQKEKEEKAARKAVEVAAQEVAHQAARARATTTPRAFLRLVSTATGCVYEILPAHLRPVLAFVQACA